MDENCLKQFETEGYIVLVGYIDINYHGIYLAMPNDNPIKTPTVNHA